MQMSEFDSEVVDSEISTDVDTSKTVNTAQPSADTIEYWKAEALKHKAIADRKSKQLESVSKTTKEEYETPKVESNTNPSSLIEEKMAAIEFKMTHPELDTQDVQAILRVSKLNGTSLEDALNDPLIKNNLEYKRMTSQNESATLNNSSSSRVATGQVSEVEKLNSLSGKEREIAILQKLREMRLN